MKRTIRALLGGLLLVALLAACGKDGKAIDQLADAASARIGVMTGSTGEAITKARFPGAQVKSFDDVMDAVAAMKSHQLDAIVTAYPLALQVVKGNPELRRIEEPLANEDSAIAVRKDNGELYAAVDGAIGEMAADGTLAAMKKRWFKTDSLPYDEPGIALPSAGVPLRIGVAATREPFSFVDQNGRISGHDGELARRIAARLRRPVEFSDMKFMALIPALQSGKVDLIVTGMTATEERSKSVDFTRPYFANAQVMLVRAAGAAAAPQAVTPPGFLTRLADSFERNIVAENRYLLLWDGLKTTVVISIAASLFGTLLGALVCFMRMSRRAALNLPARAYIALLRGTPVLVLLMLIFYVVFASVDISPVLVAVIAFGMNFAAYSAEIFRTGIEGVDPGQSEAGVSLGFTTVETFCHIVLPQTVRRILPVYRGEFISLVKMTSIVGYIAVQDLTKASDIIRSRTFDAFFPLLMIAVLYFLISWLLMQALAYVEWRIDPRARARKAGKASKESAA